MNAHRSVRLYRSLSALYPKWFRDEYGDDLVATFSEQLADESTRRVWSSTIRDLLVTVPARHMEARMNHPAPRTVAVTATGVTVAALVLAVAAGTGPVVGVFLLAAVAALIVATLGWTATRRADRNGSTVGSSWRTTLIVGVALLAAVIVVINVPPFNDRELPEAGWLIMMLALVTSIGLITIGLTTGLARRRAHDAPAR